MYILLTESRVSVGGKMSIGASLTIDGGLKAGTVVGMVGLLQF